MENKSHALAAGAFVLFVAALLVALALWLTRDTATHLIYDISSRDAVTGLQPQANVRFRGVNVGKVVAIGFDPQVRGNVLIRISTNNDAPISKSTFATLGFQGVTGLAFVQLDDSGESKETLATSDDKPARIPIRPSLLSKLADQGTSILVQVEETSRRINQLLAPDNQKLLFTAVQDIGQSAGRFGQAATSLQQFSSNASRILDAQFGPDKMNLPKLVDDMGVTLKSMQATSQSVGASADEFKGMATELRQIAKSVAQPGGALDRLSQGADALTTVGQSFGANTLPRLNRTSDEAARTARALGQAAAGLNDNPQALIYGNGLLPPGPGETGFQPPAAPARSTP